MDRKKVLTLKTLKFLEREQFNVSVDDTKTSCFDLLARRRSFILMLRFLLNIDGLSEEHAEDMKALSGLFSAYPLLIGERTRHFDLQDGVLYGRYGINAMTVWTFENIISCSLYPLVISSRGGYYVRIDGEKLRRMRTEKNISVGELAECIGVSRTMVYSYENSGLGATLSTVLRLEEYLDDTLTLPLEVFSIPSPEEHEVSVEEPQKHVFARLEMIGFDIHPIRRAPFDAVTKGEEEFMLTKVDRKPSRTIKDIRIIKEVSDVASCTAFVVADWPKAKENVAGVPVIKSSELDRIESQDEFLETLEQRR
ncbi:MAG: transcriptional regulator [Candidatus Hydrothermarchaeales archaeon]